MKNTILLIITGLLLMATSAQATQYNVTFVSTFNGAAFDASGVFTTNGTTLTGGYLTGNGFGINDTYNLFITNVPAVYTGPGTGGGDFIGVDNYFSPSGNPIVDYGGLLFVNSTQTAVLALSSITPSGPTSTYNLWEGDNTNGGWGPNANGTLTVADPGAPVPEPGTMMLLGAGFLGVIIFSKRRKNA